MNKEELEKDIIMQIEMESYMKYNDTIATMNDHLGEIYSYKDVEDVEKAQLEFEKKLAYKYLKREHQALLDIKEYLEHYGNIYVLKHNQLKNVYQWKELLDIVNKALGDKENENN